MTTTTRQRLAGGFVLGVAALAFYFGTQWKGPGLGGNGSGDGNSGPETPLSNSSPDMMESDTARTLPTVNHSEIAGDEAPESTTTVREFKQIPLVTAIISGNEYLLSRSDDPAGATPASAADVALAAIQTLGDSQGIKIRVFRKKDATAGARIDLFTKLNDAGIPNESIQEMRTFLD